VCGSGCRGDSECLPRAEDRVGVQASCCLSTTLMVCPGDKPSCEFRMRPTRSSAKGTGAQHRQALKPRHPDPHTSGVSQSLCPPPKHHSSPYQAPAPKRTNKQPQKNPSPALSQTRVSQFYNRHSEAQTQAPQHSKNLTAPRRNAAPTRTYSRPGTQSW
jgi:hypothetical protein